MDIKIVSYNIHGLPWQYDNDELICEYLIKSNADILCLQEVFTVEMNKKFEENEDLEFVFDQVREQTEDEIMDILYDR